jgi:hypothetical protein
MARTMIEEDAALPHKSQLEDIKDITALAYIAGSDTIMGAVISFFLAMLVYPDVQAKAQAEIDRVVGQDRLPELADRKELPYVEGVVNECLRWLPALPGGQSLFSNTAAYAEQVYRCPSSGDPGRCVQRVLHTERHPRHRLHLVKVLSRRHHAVNLTLLQEYLTQRRGLSRARALQPCAPPHPRWRARPQGTGPADSLVRLWKTYLSWPVHRVYELVLHGRYAARDRGRCPRQGRSRC